LIEHRCSYVCVLEIRFLHGEKRATRRGVRRVGYGAEL
jgi:hypothetical protein